MKSYDELRQAFAEVRRHSAGRKTRIVGAAADLTEDVEQAILPCLLSFSKI
jgi:hypothetical protein